ncbi:MAG: hypothetical protein ACAH80_04610 [Alphaproteobacteria bacterium]
MTSANQNDNFWFSVLVVGFIFYCQYPPNVMITKVYYAYCSDYAHSAMDCPDTVYPGMLEYKVLVEQQKVIFKSAPFPSEQLCTVFDNDNWSCEERGHRKSMNDGNFYEEGSSYVTKGIWAPKAGEKPSMPLMADIGFFHYWYLKIKNFLF